jgi:hypothetical protein
VLWWLKSIFTLQEKNLTNTPYAWPSGSHIQQPFAKSLLSGNRSPTPGMKFWLPAIPSPAIILVCHSLSTKQPQSRGCVRRICISWIQPHPHEAILIHHLNTVNLFLCSSTNYFENRLLPNDLIIIRKNEMMMMRTNWTSKGRWRGKEMCTSRWRSNPIQNFKVWLQVQLGVQDHLGFKLMYRTHTKLDLDVIHMLEKRVR